MKIEYVDKEGNKFLYNENFWTGKRELIVNDVQTQKTSKKSFILPDGKTSATVKGSFLVGVKLQVSGGVGEV